MILRRSTYGDLAPSDAVVPDGTRSHGVSFYLVLSRSHVPPAGVRILWLQPGGEQVSLVYPSASALPRGWFRLARRDE